MRDAGAQSEGSASGKMALPETVLSSQRGRKYCTVIHDRRVSKRFLCAARVCGSCVRLTARLVTLSLPKPAIPQSKICYRRVFRLPPVQHTVCVTHPPVQHTPPSVSKNSGAASILHDSRSSNNNDETLPVPCELMCTRRVLRSA